MTSLDLWREVTHIGYDNSDPPQLWAWNGEQDESAEPWFRIKFADIVETMQELFERVDELEPGEPSIVDLMLRDLDNAV